VRFAVDFIGPAPGCFHAAHIQEDIVLSERAERGAPPSQAEQAPQSTTRATAFGADLLALVLSSLDDDKAEDIVEIDLHGKSEIADAMVIASGRSSRQVQSIAEKLLDRVKDQLGIHARVEGKDSGDWVLIDAGDVIVHIFRPEVREFYQLEKMWLPAPDLAARSSAGV
jgi:ribosome-associated protein